MKPWTTLALAVAIGAASGCAAFTDDVPQTSGGRPTIAVAFYPLQFVTERIVGDHATVTDLTQPGAEPHDLELDPRQTATVLSSSLVVYEQGLQPPVDAAVADRHGPTVDAAAEAGLEPLSHGGHDDAAGDSSFGSGEETGDPGDLDPHFWQDPLKLAAVGDGVGAAMARVDPAHADTYAAHAADLHAELVGLDRDYVQGLAQCERDTVVVSHNAFGYLSRYGLFIEPIAGLSPDAEPTPADLARLQDLIRSDGITTVFGERLVSPRLSQTLADDMGISAKVLDPIEGLSDETSGEDYVSLMQQNLQALELANGCAS